MSGAWPPCPAPPRWALDWPALEAACPWLGRLRAVAQDPIHHAEGDVLTHTRLVCEALAGLAAWRALPEPERRLLLAAALFHDLGKVERTQRLEDGRLAARGHARRGALRAREVLLEAEAAGGPALSFLEREAICALVRLHALPLALPLRRDPVLDVIGASLAVRCDRLALLAEADARGRECRDQDELLAALALFREQAAALGCLERPYPFPDDHTRVTYFRAARARDGGAGPSRPPDLPAHDDTRLGVVVMAGLPGAGKDRWLEEHLRGWPVVCLDEIRREQGAAPGGGGQGAVLQEARDRARAHLRAARPFVWNATNLSRELRGRVLGLLASYHARARVVYVEAPWRELLRRNSPRARGEAAVPERVLRELLLKLDLPDLSEAHGVEHWAGIQPALQVPSAPSSPSATPEAPSDL